MNTLRLSELALSIHNTLQERFANQSFWVMADVSDHKFYADRDTHYFDLVEKDKQSGKLIARMSAVSWADGSRHIAAFEKSTGQPFKSGIQILCKVQVEFHISYGMKLRMLDVDVSFTIGELEKQKRETLERLLRECPDFIFKKGEEIVTKNKLLELNPVIQQIAIIGSKNSAGYGDFMHTLNNNQFGYAFAVDTYHTQVQGENNATALVDQLIGIYKSGKAYDLVVIIRGGGAETDFLLFNDFYLCKAIAKFPIPIVTGIGHLKDQSIADMMANTETNAPTKSAAFILAHNRNFEDELLSIQKNLVIRVQQLLANNRKRLNQVQNIVTTNSRTLLADHAQTLRDHQHLIVQSQKIIVQNKKQELLQLKQNISTFQKILLKNQRGFLNLYISLINMASPEKTLKRGFAIIRKGDQIITSPDKLKEGESIQIELQQSIITTEIKSIKDGRKNDI